MIRGLRLALLLFLLLPLAGAHAAEGEYARLDSGTVRAAIDQPQPFSADDLILLEVNAGGTVLSDSIGAYAGKAATYLPLGELSRLLDLAIFVAPPERKATGWILTQDRTFSLELDTMTVQASGKIVKLAPSDALLRGDEIYVRADVLSTLLPIEFKVNIRELTLGIRSRERLPFQQRLERAQRRAGMGPDQGEVLGEPIALPYELFSPPAMDAQVYSDFGNKHPKSRYRYELRLAGDLLHSGFQFYAGSDDRGKLNDVRLLFERKDPDGGMTPLGLTRIGVGDTYSPNLSLGAQSVSGRGIAFTNESLDQASVFNRVDLHGELPLGYEVELYVNGVLRGSQATPVGGRYDFSQVPLTYGLNVVRLIFYGSRGERREEVRRINVGGGQLEPGQTTFAFGMIQQGKSVITVDDPDDPISLSGYGDLRVTGRVAHGITPALTVIGGFARYTAISANPRSMGMIGLRTSLIGIATQFDAAADEHGGKAMGFGFAGRAGPVSFLTRHNEYRSGFIDEVVPLGASGALLRRSTDARADLDIRLGRRAVPLAFTLRRDEQVNGQIIETGESRLSTALGRFLVSTAANVQHVSGGGFSRTQINGSSDLSGLMPSNWQIRAGLFYEMKPDLRLTNAIVTADHAVSETMSMRFGVSHFFGNSATTAFQSGATFRLPFADLALNAGYTTGTKEARVGLQLAVGALFDPIARRYMLARPGVATGGSVAVAAYVDRDGNGRFDKAEDEPVEGLAVMGGSIAAKTDARGHAIVTGFGDGPRARLEVDLSALDDPYLVVDHSVFRFVPRPGKTAIAKLAFATSGEVMVRIEFDNGEGNLRGLSALGLQLIDDSGRIAAEGRTEYDGTLVLERLRPGRYTMRIDPEQAARLHLELVDPKPVIISPKGGYAGEMRTVVRLADK
jgi:hypothetical protein